MSKPNSTTQFSLFADIDDKQVAHKKNKQAPALPMFSDKDFMTPTKKTAMYGDWQGKLALEKEDPRSAEQKEADLQAEAQALTATLPHIDEDELADAETRLSAPVGGNPAPADIEQLQLVKAHFTLTRPIEMIRERVALYRLCVEDSETLKVNPEI